MFYKKFYLKLLMGLLLMAFMAPPAQAADLTVAGDNATANSNYTYVPLYGQYMDTDGTYSQIIYSKSLLSDLKGNKINSVKFYADRNLSSQTGVVVEISLMETDDEAFSSNTPLSGFPSALGSCTISGTSSELEIPLTSDFTYSGNKNLAVQVKVVGSKSSAYSTIYWYAESTTNDIAYYYYEAWTTQQGLQAYLPKTTFTYESASTDPTITVDPEALTINTDPYTAGSANFTVTGANLTGDISLSVSGSGFAVIPNTITAAEAANGKTVTVTYSAGEAGTFNGTVTLTSDGAETVTVPVTASVVAPVISGTVTPASLSFSCQEGQTNTATITVANTGNRAFTPHSVASLLPSA